MRGRDVYEGDILESPPAGPTRAGSPPWWPDFVVPYAIDPGLPDPHQVGEAMDHWQRTTRFRFVERTTHNAAAYPDWVHIRTDRSCTAHVGRRGGRQLLTLSPDRTLGNTIHELGHSVGFWHEPAAEDRDVFVTGSWTSEPDLRARLANEQLRDSAAAELSGYELIMQQPPGGRAGPTHWSRATSVLVPAARCWTLEA